MGRAPCVIAAARHQALLQDEVPRQGTGRRAANRQSPHESVPKDQPIRLSLQARGARARLDSPRRPGQPLETTPLRSWVKTDDIVNLRSQPSVATGLMPLASPRFLRGGARSVPNRRPPPVADRGSSQFFCCEFLCCSAGPVLQHRDSTSSPADRG